MLISPAVSAPTKLMGARIWSSRPAKSDRSGVVRLLCQSLATMFRAGALRIRDAGGAENSDIKEIRMS